MVTPTVAVYPLPGESCDWASLAVGVGSALLKDDNRCRGPAKCQLVERLTKS